MCVARAFFVHTARVDYGQLKEQIAQSIKHTKHKEGVVMEKIYFTIAGTSFYHGKDFFEKDMNVKLVKEPDNPYDKEAILVKVDGLGDVGHVANSPYTVVGESYSAGRLYDKIGDTAEGTVLYNVDNGVLCTISIKD